jgi:hypothetical protein
VRFPLPGGHTIGELTFRHWSNAGISSHTGRDFMRKNFSFSRKNGNSKKWHDSAARATVADKAAESCRCTRSAASQSAAQVCGYTLTSIKVFRKVIESRTFAGAAAHLDL